MTPAPITWALIRGFDSSLDFLSPASAMTSHFRVGKLAKRILRNRREALADWRDAGPPRLERLKCREQFVLGPAHERPLLVGADLNQGHLGEAGVDVGPDRFDGGFDGRAAGGPFGHRL